MFIESTTIINGLLIIGLVLLIYIAIELIRIVVAARKLINRVEVVSDIGGWFNFFRKMKRNKK
jgi:hypothetical protein